MDFFNKFFHGGYKYSSGKIAPPSTKSSSLEKPTSNKESSNKVKGGCWSLGKSKSRRKHKTRSRKTKRRRS